MASNPDRRRLEALSLALAVVTLLAYWRVGSFDFNHFDDNTAVSENLIVQAGLTREGVKFAFTSNLAAYWIPLTWLSHMLDCEIFGVHPGAHHMVNVMLHIANSVLLLWILRRMTGALWPAAFAVALFALHPLRVESVAWVVERKDVLSGLFFMLTLWAYLRHVGRPGWGRYALVLVAFALSLLAKPMAVTLPLVLLLLDYWPLRRFAWARADLPSAGGSGETVGPPSASVRRLLLEKIPLLLLALASGVATIVTCWGNMTSLQTFPLSARLANALVSYARYLGKTIWPENLIVLYPHPGHWAAWQVTGATLLLLFITWGAVIVWRRCPWFIVGWLWFLGMLAPVSGVLQGGVQAMADRFTYTPLIGLFIAFAWGADSLKSRLKLPKAAWISGATVILAACFATTWFQVAHWRNGETLWRHAVAVEPENAYAHNNLGDELSHQGRAAEAMVHYYEAIRLKPDLYSSHNNIGLALCMAGNLVEGTNHYALALRAKPDYDAAHFNYGFILASLGQFEQAIGHYEAALRAHPQHVMAHTWLGNALLAQGRTNDAMLHLTDAVRIAPNFAEGHHHLAIALAAQGKVDEAIAHWNEALRGQPNVADVHARLGLVLAAQRRSKEAIEHYRAAIRLNSQSPAILNNLAWLLATHPDASLRQGTDAVQFAQSACELTSHKTAAQLGTLAAAHAEAGQFLEAVESAKKAIEIAEAAGQGELADTNRKLLQLYQARQPYREQP